MRCLVNLLRQLSMELSNVCCALVVVPEVQIVLEVQPEIQPEKQLRTTVIRGRVKKEST